MVDYIFAHQIGFFLIGVVALGTALLALLLAVFLFIRTRRIQRDLRTFFGGKEAHTFEKIIRKNIADIREMDTDIQELYDISNTIHALAQKGTHKMSMLRFNPFKDLGGNQSFCFALLNGANSGVIISSLHTREGTRIYAKRITAGAAPDHELTEEEKHVLAEARAQESPTHTKRSSK